MRLHLIVLLAIASLTACDGDPDPSRLDLSWTLRAQQVRAGRLHAGAGHDRVLFDENWYEPRKDQGAIRGTRGAFELIAPAESPTALDLELRPESALVPLEAEVRLNGYSLGEVELAEGWQRVRFELEGARLTGERQVVEIVAARSTDASGRDLSIACGAVGFVAGPSGTGTMPTLVAPAPDAESLVLDVGDASWIDLDVHPGSRVRLELEGEGELLVRVRTAARETDERVRVSGTAQWSRDLAAFARQRVVLELVGAEGSVNVARADLEAPRAFSNLLVVSVDTLRADYVLSKEDDIDTPEFDRFAEESTVFEWAFSHANTTLPSHTALFSSRYPHMTGVIRNGTRVGRGFPLLAESLSRLGYRTHATISMGTLQPIAPGLGVDRGFAVYDTDLAPSMTGPWANERLEPVLRRLAADPAPWFVFAHYADPHNPYRAHGSVVREARISLDGEELDVVSTPEVVWWKREVRLSPGESRLRLDGDHRFGIRDVLVTGPNGTLATRVEDAGSTDDATRVDVVIENPAAEDSTAEVSMWLADFPTPGEWKDRYGREVEFADAAVGELFDSMRELGLWDDTVVVFTSDHGEGLGEHGVGGHGPNLYDEQIHVPLMLKTQAGHPGRAALARATGTVVRHVDVTPTILELLELPPLEGALGTSLLADAPRQLVSEAHIAKRDRDIYSLRDDHHKLIYVVDRDLFQLFDIVEDPDETIDLFESRGSEFEAWRQTLLQISAGKVDSDGTRAELDPEVEHLLRGLGYTE